jgi:hypothetical protein
VRDPDEKRRDAFRAIGRKMDVLLDGRVVTKVIGYNVELGRVLRFRTDAEGRIILIRDSAGAATDAATETLHGIVEARWHRESQA